MDNDYLPPLTFGIFAVVLVIYVGTIALALWIGYLIMRTAVKNGILRADVERGQLTPAGPSAPAGWYDSSGGRRYWNGRDWTTPPV